jgi:hypothetical protein
MVTSRKPPNRSPLIDPAFANTGPGRQPQLLPHGRLGCSVRGTLGEARRRPSPGWRRRPWRGGCDGALPHGRPEIGWVREPDFAVALCRAYNDFFHHEFTSTSLRLGGRGAAAVAGPGGGVEELQRARLGVVGAMLPAVGLRKPSGMGTSGRSTRRRSGSIAWWPSATVRGPHYFGADLFDTLSGPHARTRSPR